MMNLILQIQLCQGICSPILGDPSDATPRPKKVVVRHGAGPLPEVVFCRAGKEVAISYDEYLNRTFIKDSSSDEEFIVETPNDLLDSLKA